MPREQILYPALTVVALTFIVGFMLLRARFLAVRRREINPRYFLLNRGGKVPEYLQKLEQNYCNLFELPVLFYLLTLMLYATNSVNALVLWVAWGFAATRIVHTLVHITVNRLRWRMAVFLTGALLLLAGWMVFLFRLTSAAF
jgi:hypothetical protein